jgi:hypothetical protein
VPGLAWPPMALSVIPPETDLVVPLPDGRDWDPCTTHTHYFGFAVPEARIGCFLYVRYLPFFAQSQGGICVFRGLSNGDLMDMDFLDYRISMPWPQIDGTAITTANGLRVEFLEPGRRARVSYRSRDGDTWLDVTQTAISPLLARGYLVPGEETHHDVMDSPGGSEQFMHATGTLVLRGERFAVDSLYPRDRTWRQVRGEEQGGAVPYPPIAWTPVAFGEDFSLNAVSFEALDTGPDWAGLYQLPPDRPAHHFAWVVVDGEVREIESIRRRVTDRHPLLYLATRQEIEATDATGAVHRFTGEAIAAAAVPTWPNAAFRDSVYRWESEDGRTTHCTYQEFWTDRYHLHMRDRMRLVGGGAR